MTIEKIRLEDQKLIIGDYPRDLTHFFYHGCGECPDVNKITELINTHFQNAGMNISVSDDESLATNGISANSEVFSVVFSRPLNQEELDSLINSFSDIDQKAIRYGDNSTL